MKKIYFIIGIVTVLLLLGIWIYLLIYGTPKPVENFFTDFSFSGNNENTEIQPIMPVSPEVIVDTQFAKLRQLTTKPVIGMGEYTESDSSPTQMRYAEAGTGHVFSINLETGALMRLSNITIPNATKAVFSLNGIQAVITSGYGTKNTLTLLTLNNEDNAVAETLSEKAVDLHFSTQNELLFTELTSSGQNGLAYNINTKTSRFLFSVPFQSATVVWGKEAAGKHYTYPKPSTKLTGYLYAVEPTNFKRLDVSGKGLTALAGDEYIVYTSLIGDEPTSRAMNKVSGTSIALPIVADPNKCIIGNVDNTTMYCGNIQAKYGYNFPDDWYKGTRSFADMLYKIDLKRGSATKIASPIDATGREIDVLDMNISSNDKVLYFMNKNDNTLWMYEI